MKRIWSNLPLAFITMASTLILAVACTKGIEKPDDAQLRSLKVKQETRTAIVTGNPVIDTLIAKYNLYPLTRVPSGFQYKAVTSVAEGSAFMDNVNYQMSISRKQEGTKFTIVSSMLKGGVLESAAPGVLTPMWEGDLEPCGRARATAPFGNWSIMTITFDYCQNPDGSYSVSNVTTTVTGFVFGIGYTQGNVVPSNNPTGTVGFVVNGVVTAGISVGSSTFGYNYNYMYQVQWNPNNPASSQNFIWSGPGSKL